MSESKELTIGTLPVNVEAKLGETVRKNLMDIVEVEFKNRITVDQIKKNESRQEVIERYKKKFEIEKLTKKINQLKVEIRETEQKIDALGFSTYDGKYNGRNPEIEKELESLNRIAADIQTVKHKIQTRLMLSTTVGEATVIMHEILGNTLIPTLKTNAITFNK